MQTVVADLFLLVVFVSSSSLCSALEQSLGDEVSISTAPIMNCLVYHAVWQGSTSGALANSSYSHAAWDWCPGIAVSVFAPARDNPQPGALRLSDDKSFHVMQEAFADNAFDQLSCLQLGSRLIKTSHRVQYVTAGQNHRKNHSRVLCHAADCNSTSSLSTSWLQSASSSFNSMRKLTQKRVWDLMNGQTSSEGPNVSTHACQHDYEQQRRAFTIVVSITCCAMAALVWCSRRGLETCPVSLLSCLGCFFFGMDNFLMDYASCYLQKPTMHAAMSFLCCGVIAVAIHFFSLFYRPSYKVEYEDAATASWPNLVLLTLAGVLTAGGQISGNIGFNIDQRESGPHQALVCGTVLIVAPFFYFHSGECLAKVELMGLAFILGGIIFTADILNWSGNSDSWYAYLWLVLSMVIYALSSIAWRLAATHEDNMSWQPQILIIFGCMGLTGFCLSVAFVSGGGYREYSQHPALLLWPLLNAAATFLGMVCLNLAFQKPDVSAGLVTAVVDSNSVVMLVLNKLILGLVPSASRLVGMTLILLGVVVVCSEDFMYSSAQLVRQGSPSYVRQSSTLSCRQFSTLSGRQYSTASAVSVDSIDIDSIDSL